jgi:hypothetical protein
MPTKSALYLKDAQLFLDSCTKTHDLVTVKALKADGSVMLLEGWMCISGWWVKGSHDFKNPRNGQIRKVRDVLIFNINGHPVYI